MLFGESVMGKEGRHMVIQAAATLALYCSRCGKIHTHDIELFSLRSKKRVELCCSCGHKQAVISAVKRGQVLLTVFCELCRENHVLVIDFRHICAAELQKLYCMTNNLELGFVGDRRLIEQTIERHRSEVNRALPDRFTPDTENAEVMLDILNRLHDIAEKGGVTCCCGSTSIRATVLPCRIELRCQTCGAYETFSACNDVDLARVESVELIELSLPYHSRRTH